jgi:hypothetical protein
MSPAFSSSAGCLRAQMMVFGDNDTDHVVFTGRMAVSRRPGGADRNSGAHPAS